MKFACKREDLLAGVATVQRAAPARTTLPILSGVLLEASGDKVRMVCTDLDMAIETCIPVETSEEGSGVIPIKYLYDIVRHMNGDTVSFECTDHEGSILILRCGKAVFEISTMNPAEFPDFPEVEGGETLTVSGSSLGSLISQTIFAASTDDARPFLTGGYLEVSGKMMSIVATDTFRLAISKIEIASDSNGDVSTIVPARALLELGRIIGAGDPSVGVTLSGKQISFNLGNTRMVSRVIAGKFPDYKQVIPTALVALIKADRQALIGAVERTSVLSRDDFASVGLVVESGHILVKSDLRDVGRAQDEVECEFLEGSGCEVVIRSRYVLEGLRAMAGEKVVIGFSGPDRPVSFRREEGDAYLYLVMPVAFT